MTPQLKAILHREDKRYGSGCPVMGTVGQGCDLAARHIQKTHCNRMGLGSWGGQGTVRVWGYHTNPDPSGFPDPSPG